MGCCSSFIEELNPCQPWFSVTEHGSDKDLDIAESFGPRTWLVILGKFCALAFVASTQAYALLETPDLSFYFAYFTSWALAVATIYEVISFVNSIIPIRQPIDDVVSWRIQASWLIFVLALMMEFLTAVIFWTLVYEGGTLEYLDVAAHGPVWIVVMLDGFWLNRITLRFMHMWAVLAIMGAFLIWSFVHGPMVLDIGNPNESDNDPDTNDDAIYASLSWDNDDIVETAILAAIVYFGVVPVLFAISRAVSRRSWIFGQDRRRYFKEGKLEGTSPRGEQYYQEEDSSTDQEAGVQEPSVSVY